MTNIKSPKLRLYSITPFDRSAKVRWLMTELGLDFETRWLDTEKNELEDPDFLRRSPMGRVPVLEIDDQAISESSGICAYLSDRYLEKQMAPPLDSPERAKYQQWMYFASSTVEAFQTQIMIIEDISPGDIHAAKLSALQSNLRDALVTLDQTFEKSSYLVGNRFGTADICLSYNLYWCALWPELSSILAEFPRVTAYLERLKGQKSAVAADVFSYQG